MVTVFSKTYAPFSSPTNASKRTGACVNRSSSSRETRPPAFIFPTPSRDAHRQPACATPPASLPRRLRRPRHATHNAPTGPQSPPPDPRRSLGVGLIHIEEVDRVDAAETRHLVVARGRREVAVRPLGDVVERARATEGVEPLPGVAERLAPVALAQLREEAGPLRSAERRTAGEAPRAGDAIDVPRRGIGRERHVRHQTLRAFRDTATLLERGTRERPARPAAGTRPRDLGSVPVAVRWITCARRRGSAHADHVRRTGW